MPNTNFWQATLKPYGGTYLVLVAFCMASFIRLVSIYWTSYAEFGAKTDFGVFHAAAIAHQQGINPYDYDALTPVYEKYVTPQIGGKKGAVPYLYPPFSLLFYKSFMGPGTLANFRLFAVFQILFQLGALLIVFAFSVHKKVSPLLTLTAIAVLSLFYLEGSPAQDAIAYGQMSPLIGLLIVASVALYAIHREAFAYVLMAVGASLKLVPILLLGIFKVKPVKAILWFAIPCVLLNLVDIALLQDFIQAHLTPERKWIDFAYHFPVNHSLPAMSFRQWGTDAPGKLVGMLLFGLSTALIAAHRLAELRWFPKLTTTATGPEAVFVQSAFFFTALSLSASLFWHHHLTMYIPLYFLAEVLLAAKNRPLKQTDYLAYCALALLMFYPKITLVGKFAFAGIVVHNLFTIGAIMLWFRYLLLIGSTLQWATVRFRSPQTA